MEDKGEELRKGKESRHRRRKTTPSGATDTLTGDEEQNGIQKRKKKKNKEWVLNPATLDYSVTSYDAQGSYGEAILLTSQCIY